MLIDSAKNLAIRAYFVYNDGEIHVTGNCPAHITGGCNMAIFCQNCGSQMEDNGTVCANCGADQRAFQSNCPSPNQVPQVDTRTVSTLKFFGLILLFSLPMVGWIICLVMAFAAKNENVRHFARANMIWILIGLLLSAVAFGILIYDTDVFVAMLGAELGIDPPQDWSAMDEFFYSLGDALYT